VEPDRLEAGRLALEAGDWNAARSAFDAVLEAGESAAALDGAGLARWFLGELSEGEELRARAFDLYVRDGNVDRAARVGVWLSHQQLISGRASASRGWLARAERVVAGAPFSAGAGWVAVELARRAPTLDECATRAGRALDVARRNGDADLEIFALSVLGRAEVAAGRIETGARMLEEAMAAASAGRVRNLHTLGEAYCNLIIAANVSGDFERAAEWCRTVDEFAVTHGAPILLGACRTVHADVLMAIGRWDDAEAALEDAIAAHELRYAALGLPAVAALASLRVRQGRLGEAEQLLAGRGEQPSALLALAELRRAQGEPRAAIVLLERALAAAQSEPLATVRLLTALADACVAAGDVAGAEAAAVRLRSALAESDSRLGAAYGELTSARVALARHDVGEAREHARRALECFGALSIPYEAAEARLELARALRDEAPGVALDEARTALQALRRLGAAGGAGVAASLVRELGGGTPAGTRVDGDLTARERQVLALVAQGFTNARIGEALFISEKTAGHHVSRILAKLGARNRVEAVSLAARLGDE